MGDTRKQGAQVPYKASDQLAKERYTT